MSYRGEVGYYEIEPTSDLSVEVNTLTVSLLLFVASLFLMYMLWVSCARGDLNRPTEDSQRPIVLTKGIQPHFVVIQANGPDEKVRILQEYDAAKPKRDVTFCENCTATPSGIEDSTKHQSIPTVPDYDFGGYGSRTNLLTIKMDMPPPSYSTIN